MASVAVYIDREAEIVAEQLESPSPDDRSAQAASSPGVSDATPPDENPAVVRGAPSLPGGAPGATLSSKSFVQIDGTQFTLDGKPFRFVGFNLFDAAGTPSGYHCAWWTPYSDEELDEALRYMHTEAGATVLRFWAFQSYTGGGTDWNGIDRVLRLARSNGMRVIPVLENGQSHCSEGGSKWLNDGDWYTNAYRRDYHYGYPLSLPEYVERIVQRYKHDPTILGWMVMNEAETDNIVGLYGFAQSMTALIKRVDPNHPVTLGTQSTGQPGTRGADFVRLYSLATIDYVEGHDYAPWGVDGLTLPGSKDGASLPDPATCDNYQLITCSMSQALHTLQKPFIVGEAGVQIQPSGIAGVVQGARTPEQRAAILDAKMHAAFANGVSGYLIWQWNRRVDQGYDILIGDPLVSVMQRYAAELNRSP
jgi:hypothetical protein